MGRVGYLRVGAWVVVWTASALVVSERSAAEDEPVPPQAAADDEKVKALARAQGLDGRVNALHDAGKYAEAEPLARESLAITEKAFGPDHPETGTRLNNLAMLLQDLGDYAEAKPLYVQALAISERALGPDHPETGVRSNNLAMLLQDVGDYLGAKPLLVRALAISEKALGPDHPETGASLLGLASLLKDMGDYAEAKPLFVRALAISEKALGPDHPDTGASLLGLASLLREVGDYAEAKPLFVRALAISEEARGSAHPETGTRLDNLATLLQAMGDYAGAKPLYVRALAITEKAHGPDHASTGVRVDNLAALLQNMGDYAGAQPLYVRALAISERALGPDHPETGARLEGLASLLQDMGDYAEAKPLLVRALAISEKALGPDHPETGTSLNGLASLLQDMGDYAGAKPLYVRALANAEKALGPYHPETGTSLSNLALLLKDMGDCAGAKPLLVRALAISERALGPDHPETGASLNGLAMLLQDMGDYAGAKPLFVRALAISEKARGPDHPETGSCLNNLAALIQATGEYAEAKPLYVRALAISEKARGPDHPETGSHLNNLGVLLHAMGDYAGAKPLLVQALAIAEEAQGADHPSTGTKLSNLAMVLHAMGDYAAAKPLSVRALAISEKDLGADHPATGSHLKNLGVLLHAMGDYAGARPLFVRALGNSEAFIRRESLRTHSAERRALARKCRWHLDSYLAVSEKLGSSGYPELVRFKGLVARLDAMDRLLARNASPAVHERVASLVAVGRRLAAMANAVPPARDEAKTKAWQETYAALAAEREEATRRLAEDFAPFRETLEGKEPGSAEVQSALAPDEVVIDVLLSRGRYLAWLVPATGDVVRIDLGKAEDIESAAEAFVQASHHPESKLDSADWLAAGTKLRDLALAPLQARFPAGTRTLYLVPDAALAAVPFDALPGKEPGTTLIDEVRVVHLSRAQNLVAEKDAAKSGRGALLVGGVDYEKSEPMGSAETPAGSTSAPSSALGSVDRAPQGGRYDALPATRQEVEGLGQRLGVGATALLGSQGTEARVRALAVGRRILHLATHGFVREDLLRGLRRSARDEERWMTGGMERHLAGGHDPMLLAGLAMAGANPRDGADGDDGILTAAEASYMNLDGCDLVVLSACETAKGTPESGQGVLGLVHGFELAGARSVVGSLWKVDDDATRLLMERFYEGYLRKEKPLAPSEALREAAVWLRDIKPGGKDYSSPRYWAAFVCYERGRQRSTDTPR